jgi:hypothetical protein
MSSRRAAIAPRLLLLTCTILAVARPAGAVVAQGRASEADVKAAYLFNFAQFVRWPQDAIPAGAPFTICILGRDPFGASLDRTLGKDQIDGRPVAARRITKVEEASTCQIVYVSDSERTRLDTVLRTLGQRHTLTVSDLDQFVERGGMIQFVPAGNRIRFALNLHAAAAVQLEPSSELARVAVTVRGTQAE